MIYPIKKVSGGIDMINEVPLVFLENVFLASECNEKLFPIWFRKVYKKCPGVKDRFMNLFIVFKKLNKKKQNEIIDLYRNSNNINRVCTDSSTLYPTIKRIDDRIQNALIKLFTFLYEETIDTDIFRKQSKMSINDHYEKFQNVNNVFVCPFCGLETYTLPKFRRAEYDHFLPISLYPWLGVNFNNLVPMGDHCNGKKNNANPLYADESCTIRRQVLYPYEWINHNIKLQCLDKPTLANMGGSWNFELKAMKISDQGKIQTWNDIFKITDQFSDIMSRFHMKFIEDFAHKNGLKKKILTIDEIKKQIRIYQNRGIGQLNFEPLAKLKFLWSHYYSCKASDSEIILIQNKIKFLPERNRP